MNTKEKVFCKDKKDFCNKYGCIGCEFAKGNGIIPPHYANDVLSTVFGLDYNLDKIRETIKADREGRCVVLDSQERAVSFKRAFEIMLKTGDYSIERIGELVEADREGRCGVAPVKLHQPIYRVFGGRIIKETVCQVAWEPFSPRPRWKVWVMGGGLPYYWDECINKIVFLSKEEAEQALKK